MRMNTIGKWSLKAGSIIVILIFLAFIALYILIDRTVDRVYGGQTKVADHVQFQVDAQPTEITNVNVLSPDGTKMLPDRTVFLDDGKIISITPDAGIPEGVSTIDGRGKYLIPGLTDSHVHMQRSPNDLLLYVANGVTQIRSMGGSNADLALKSEIENGRIGPHFYVSSPSMNSADGFGEVAETLPSWIPGPVSVWLAEKVFNIHIAKDATTAAGDARSFIKNGHNGFKLYQFLTMDAFSAILEVAEELDVPTAAHLPEALPLSELRTTKLREIAHIEEIVKKLLGEFGDFESREGSAAFLEFVNSRKDEIVADIVANDISVQSTLWLSESFYDQVFSIEVILAVVKLEYANPGIVEGVPASADGSFPGGWIPGRNKFEAYAGNEPDEIARQREFWDAREEAHRILLRAMVNGGVTILAGTDANAWLTVPGFSLHDELQSLNRAGMSPAQTINAATAAPAHRINNNAGIIEVGRRADLVLLNANPLTDIRNTTAIDTVILNGKILGRPQLDAMLDSVKAANASSRTIDISAYQMRGSANRIRIDQHSPLPN